MEWKVNKAFRTLMSYSLIQPVKGEESVEMHLLVQSVIREAAGIEREMYFMESAELIRRRFPWGGNAATRRGCLKYLSQAQNCVAIAEWLQIENSIITYILRSMAWYFQFAGQLKEAFISYNRALKIDEREFGVDHINSADTIMGIGLVYNSQGKYAEAISWYERALKIKEREFGVDHINSADTINNIGECLSSQGKYVEAISWYERALKIKEREFGVDHINSADTIMNIGSVY